MLRFRKKHGQGRVREVVIVVHNESMVVTKGFKFSEHRLS